MANKILKGFYGKDGEKYELPETDSLVGENGAGELRITKDGDGDGQLELSLHCSDPDDEFLEEISKSQISNAIHPVSTPVAGSKKLITSGGVKAALDDKANKIHSHYEIGSSYAYLTVDNRDHLGCFDIEMSNNLGDTEEFNHASINALNLSNLNRALNSPDTAPKANSSNLVTSGGVKAALDSKMDNRGVDTTPRSGSSNLITSGAVYAAILELNSSINAALTRISDLEARVSILEGTEQPIQILNFTAPAESGHWSNEVSLSWLVSPLSTKNLTWSLRTSRPVELVITADYYKDIAPEIIYSSYIYKIIKYLQFSIYLIIN